MTHASGLRDGDISPSVGPSTPGVVWSFVLGTRAGTARQGGRGVDEKRAAGGAAGLIFTPASGQPLSWPPQGCGTQGPCLLPEAGGPRRRHTLLTPRPAVGLA